VAAGGFSGSHGSGGSRGSGGSDGTSLILAHTNQDVRELNALVRAERQRAGELADEAPFQTARGARHFAAGDRLVFLRNDRDLGVKNGTLATVEQAAPGRLVARLDGGGRVSVEQAVYAQIDHGYAVTLHKAQGATVERAFVLASGGMDRHLAYVGMTRHRAAATLYAGRDDFRDEAALARRLSRARPKASTLDFAERRGFETPKAWSENARAWLERGRERLDAAWQRAEQVVVAVRQRLAGQARPQAERTSERTTEERAAALRARFAAPEPEAGRETAAARQERLRAQFAQEGPKPRTPEQIRQAMQEQAREPEANPEARRQALREAFAKDGPAKPKTPEQMREALQARDKPAAERRPGKGQGKDQGQDSER
jgi:hypothetical protein